MIRALAVILGLQFLQVAVKAALLSFLNLLLHLLHDDIPALPPAVWLVVLLMLHLLLMKVEFPVMPEQGNFE